MRIAYRSKKFSADTLELIDVCNEIIEEYVNAGYQLTLRQLFYQLVARMVIPNTQVEYKRVGRIIADARDCGETDWGVIEDRTRNLYALPNWDGPKVHHQKLCFAVPLRPLGRAGVLRRSVGRERGLSWCD